MPKGIFLPFLYFVILEFIYKTELQFTEWRKLNSAWILFLFLTPNKLLYNWKRGFWIFLPVPKTMKHILNTCYTIFLSQNMKLQSFNFLYLCKFLVPYHQVPNSWSIHRFPIGHTRVTKQFLSEKKRTVKFKQGSRVLLWMCSNHHLSIQ
jgi:hypothetical protein